MNYKQHKMKSPTIIIVLTLLGTACSKVEASKDEVLAIIQNYIDNDEEVQGLMEEAEHQQKLHEDTGLFHSLTTILFYNEVEAHFINMTSDDYLGIRTGIHGLFRTISDVLPIDEFAYTIWEWSQTTPEIKTFMYAMTVDVYKKAILVLKDDYTRDEL